MRGDRPPFFYTWSLSLRFTPHARGSTLVPDEDIVAVDVYPACAGIDPAARSDWILQSSLPRMRGDRPAVVARE